MLALEEHHADIGLSVYVCVECHHWYLTNWDIEAGVTKPRRKDDNPRRETVSVDYQINGVCRIFILMCQRYGVPQGSEMLRTLDAALNGLQPSRPRARRVGKQRYEPESGDDLVITHTVAEIQSALLERTVTREGFTPFGIMAQTILRALKLIEDYPIMFGQYLREIDLTDLQNIANVVPKAYGNVASRQQREDDLSVVIMTVITGFLTYMRVNDPARERIYHE